MICWSGDTPRYSEAESCSRGSFMASRRNNLTVIAFLREVLSWHPLLSPRIQTEQSIQSTKLQRRHLTFQSWFSRWWRNDLSATWICFLKFIPHLLKKLPSLQQILITKFWWKILRVERILIGKKIDIIM